MFQTFYELREQPFGTNPDPRFLYQSRTHREAFSSLLYRIQTDSGFLAMVAQPGMGKTTLLFHLLNRLQPSARTAFIFETQCTSHELLRQLLSEFECDTSITDPVRISRELKSVLLAEANEGRRCILVIDEAQNLASEVLETVRLLSDFETPQRKLLQIILSGQVELGELLASRGLLQLRQRLACIVHIQKFTPEETALYIAHRLKVAGYSGRLSQIFSLGALTRIAQLSEGIPRVINNICFNSLSLGFALESKQIGPAIIEEVAHDLGLPGIGGVTQQESAGSRAAFFEEFPVGVVTGNRGRESEVSAAIAAACSEWERAEGQDAALQLRVETNETNTRVQSCAVPPDSPLPLAAEACVSSVAAAMDVVPDLDKATEAEAGAEFESRLRIVKEGDVADLGIDRADRANHADRPEGQIPMVARKGAKVPGARIKLNHSFMMGGFACALLLWIAPTMDSSIPHQELEGPPVVHAKNLPPADLDSQASREARATDGGKSMWIPPARVAASAALEHHRPYSTKTSLHGKDFLERKTVAAGGNSGSAAPPNKDGPLPSHWAPATGRRAPATVPRSTATYGAVSVSHATAKIRVLPDRYLPPRAIWHPAPNYPELALTSEVTGDVLLLVSVSSRGTVENIKVIKGSTALVSAAESAVKQWKYLPALSNGRPVDAEAFATLQFRLY